MQEFINEILTWIKHLFGCDTMNKAVAEGFAELFSACLDNPILRAICSIIYPSCKLSNKSDQANQFLLIEFISNIHRNRNENLVLSLLKELSHPGVSKLENGTYIFEEPDWITESNWLLDVKTRVSLLFDSNTFPLLSDAAYLIFRYLSKDFQNIGDKNISLQL